MPKNEILYTCDCHEVVINTRQRKKMNPKKFKELCESISEHGQLQPGVCRLDEDGSPVLVFGERRLRACTELGCEFTYRLREDMSDDEAFEIELIENIHREDLSWQDKAQALLQLHELRQKQAGTTSAGSRGGHGVRDTAAEIGASVGIVQEDIELAMFAAQVPEVANAPNKTIAKSIVKRMKDEYIRKEALDESLRKAEETTNKLIEEGTEAGEDQISLLEARLLEYDSRCLLGDFETEAETLEAETFDVICFDPPWAVGLDTVSKQTGKTQAYDDDPDGIERFEEWANILFWLAKPNSHVYVFFGIVHHREVYEALEAAGFTTNRMPIFWKKRGAHRTRAPEIWPGRCYESIAYARKGSKRLVQMGRPDIIETQPPTAKIKLSHPSAKHPDIYRDLLLRSCTPGDRVLDPMGGSGMFGVACESLRVMLSLDWTMIEQDDDFRTLQLHNLNKGYGKIVGDTQGFDQEQIGTLRDRDIPELPTDFKGLDVGSDDWKRFWKANPDKQDAMIEWRNSHS